MNRLHSNIVIIGCGQLGSRHLQGLTRLEQKIQVSVIEPNYKAREIARKRYYEMPENRHIQSIAFLDSMVKLNDKVDLAIIATNADIRREVIENLLKITKVKNLLLEKVVFQTVKDFKEIMYVLEEMAIKVWVNCPRRIYPFYEELKKRTVDCSNISITVEGGNWGLACNTIHMLDLFAFLTEQTKFKIYTSNLHKMLYESKRKGFIELGGELHAENQRGDTLVLVDNRNNQSSNKLNISFEGIIIEIDENSGFYLEYHKENSEKQVKNYFQVPLQSELTGKIAEQILQKGNSKIPSLDESFQLHKPMLEAFNRHISSILHEKLEICPIT